MSNKQQARHLSQPPLLCAWREDWPTDTEQQQSCPQGAELCSLPPGNAWKGLPASALWLRAAQTPCAEPRLPARPAGVWGSERDVITPIHFAFTKPFKVVFPERVLKPFNKNAALQFSGKSGWGGRPWGMPPGFPRK